MLPKLVLRELDNMHKPAKAGKEEKRNQKLIKREGNEGDALNMESIHELSALAPLPELDLFGVPPTQNSIERDIYSEHRPISTLNSTSAITFVIPTPIDEYLQLRECMLYMKIKINIKKSTDVIAADWAKVSTTGYLLHSLFKQVEVELNNKSITSGNPTYGYKAYFDTLLHFSTNAHSSHLTGALWDPNTFTTADEDTINNTRNTLITPSTTTKDGRGKSIELMGKLHIDLAYQNRALIGGSQLKVTLMPHSPEFFAMSTDNALVPTVEFEAASLYVHRSRVSPLIVSAHARALTQAPAKYPYTRREVKAFSISQGSTSAHLDNIVLGVIPRRIFVAMVDNTAFTGNLIKNPYNFKHNNVNYLALVVDGEQIPSTPYTPDFPNRLITREYMGYMEALNQLTSDTISGPSKDGWYQQPIFGFNLAPDLSDGVQGSGHVNRIKRGSMRLELRFSIALMNTTTVLIYCEYDSLLQIDKNREVYLDFK